MPKMTAITKLTSLIQETQEFIVIPATQFLKTRVIPPIKKLMRRHIAGLNHIFGAKDRDCKENDDDDKKQELQHYQKAETILEEIMSLNARNLLITFLLNSVAMPIIRKLMHHPATDEQQATLGELMSIVLLTLLVQLYLLRKVTILGSLQNVLFLKTLMDELKEVSSYNSHAAICMEEEPYNGCNHLHPCEHKDQHAQANSNSTLYYILQANGVIIIAKIIEVAGFTLHVIGDILWYLPFAGNTMQCYLLEQAQIIKMIALLIGYLGIAYSNLAEVFCIDEYSQAILGVCTTDRYRRLQENFPHFLKQAFLFFAINTLLPWPLASMTHNDSIYTIVTAMTTPYFIVNAVLNNKSFPGGHSYPDVFLQHREVTDFVAKKSIEKIMPLIKRLSEEEAFQQEIITIIKKRIPYVKFTAIILLPRELLNPEKLVCLPAVNWLICNNSEDIKSILKTLKPLKNAYIQHLLLLASEVTTYFAPTITNRLYRRVPEGFILNETQFKMVLTKTSDLLRFLLQKGFSVSDKLTNIEQLLKAADHHHDNQQSDNATLTGVQDLSRYVRENHKQNHMPRERKQQSDWVFLNEKVPSVRDTQDRFFDKTKITTRPSSRPSSVALHSRPSLHHLVG